jgi:2-C-methyl-D-erythritol 4-phosphate cytidylyltransferase
MKAAAIIVAAGTGARFGSRVPKQFLELAGKSIVRRAVEQFENCPAINEIILVLPGDQIKDFSARDLTKLKKITAGGASRAESVFIGLQKIEKAEIVAVHDGARPLVSVEEISAIIEKTRETGAACLVAHVTDTIKEIADGKILRTVDRAKLRRALTPQCFRTEILRHAFAAVKDLSAAAATDESVLVEQIGVPISIVEGSPRNLKITVPEDLILAESLLREL